MWEGGGGINKRYGCEPEFKAHTQKTPQSPLSRLTIGTQNGMVSETPTYAASAIEIMNSLLAEDEASVSARSPIGIMPFAPA